MDVKWNTEKEEFWTPFGNMNLAGRRKFLLENNLQYKDVPKCRGCNHVFFGCVCDNEEYQSKIRGRKILFNADFEEKLNHSRRLVERVLREHKDKKVVLAYSGGIDSECCVQLFKEAVRDGRIQVVFGNTLVNFPEAYERVRELEQEFNIKIVRAKPERGISFRTIVRDYGLPIYSRSSRDKQKRKATINCCYLLKKKPMKVVTKTAKVLILGLRGEENNNRKLGIYNHGDYFKSKKGKWHIYPIAYWTRGDLWKFQELENFNYNKIYDHTNCGKKGVYKCKNNMDYIIRTGCWSCPQAVGFGYLEWLEKYYPRFHKVLMVNFGLQEHPRYHWLLAKQKKDKLKKKGFKPCGLEKNL